MTEVDYSPQAYRQFQRTQQRINNWTVDTARDSHKYQNPFLPRPEAELRANEFYNPKQSSRSSSSSSSKHNSSRKTPQRSYSQGIVSPPERDRGGVRSPLRSKTIALVSPDDSISQVGIARPRPRARSHSPSSRQRSSRKHHRSGTATYVVHQPQPQPAQQAYNYTYGTMAYVQSPGAYVQQQPVTGYFQQPVQVQPPQPQVYVVYPKDKRVQIVYPDATHHASPTSGSGTGSGGFFSRIFSKSGSSSRRSRSVDMGRSRR